MDNAEIEVLYNEDMMQKRCGNPDCDDPHHELYLGAACCGIGVLVVYFDKNEQMLIAKCPKCEMVAGKFVLGHHLAS